MMKKRATEILSEELKKETTHYMNRCILQYLLKRVEESDALAEDICQEHKSFEKCIKYVYQAAYDKMALGFKDGKIDTSKCIHLDNGAIGYGDKLDDQFTYEAAEDYYHIDDYDQWKKEQEESEKKKAEVDKQKAKSDLTKKEAAKKKAIKAMNDAAKKLATDPQNEELAEAYAKSVEEADKANAEYDAAKAKYDAKYPESKEEKKPAKKRGKKAKKEDITAETETEEKSEPDESVEDTSNNFETTVVSDNNAEENNTESNKKREENSIVAEQLSLDIVSNDMSEDTTKESEEESSGKIIQFTSKESNVTEQTKTILVTDYSMSTLYVAFKDMADLSVKEPALVKILSDNPGSNEVYVYVSNPKGQKKLNICVSLSDSVVDELRSSFGDKNIYCSKTSTKEVTVMEESLRKAN